MADGAQNAVKGCIALFELTACIDRVRLFNGRAPLPCRASQLGDFADKPKQLEVTAETWNELRGRKDPITLFLAIDNSPRAEVIPDTDKPPTPIVLCEKIHCCCERAESQLPRRRKTDPVFQIAVETLTGKRINLEVSALDTVLETKAQLYSKEGIPTCEQRLTFGGRQLEDRWTLGHYAVQSGSIIYIILRLKGGKPVIYLFPPKPISASVRLDLCPQWSFSALYPASPTVLSAISANKPPPSIQWEVNVQKDGELVDRATGTKASYLFWEAL